MINTHIGIRKDIYISVMLFNQMPFRFKSCIWKHHLESRKKKKIILKIIIIEWKEILKLAKMDIYGSSR